MNIYDSRVAAYEAARPGYPQAIVATLKKEFGLQPNHLIVDIGAGSGKLTALFLENGYDVIAVEPGDGMRMAAEARFAGNARFSSHRGTAEATGLGDQSVDWIVVGQAAHWFDLEPARREFARILRPGGGMALMWNMMNPNDSATAGLRQVLNEHRLPTPPARRPNSDEANRRILLGKDYDAFVFEQESRLDQETLTRLALSRSYSPKPDDPGYRSLLAAIELLFKTHAVDGSFVVRYETELFVNRNDRPIG